MIWLDTTINKLRLGSKLVLGRYTAGSPEPEPIIWLKGSKDNEFISEYVLDILELDVQGRNTYIESTIFMFANSAEDDLLENPQAYSYRNNSGFLKDFEAYEIEAVGEVNLPSKRDVFSPLMGLFNKKGRRAYLSSNCKKSYRYPEYYSSYSPYWFSDINITSDTAVRYGGALIMSYDGGGTSLVRSNSRYGFRPKCKIRGDLKVRQEGDYYYLVPFESNYKKSSDIEPFDEQDILALFGIK